MEPAHGRRMTDGTHRRTGLSQMVESSTRGMDYRQRGFLCLGVECVPDPLGCLRPFSPPESLTIRLERLAARGVVACITPHAAGGRHTSHGHAGDWRDDDPNSVPSSLVHTSREDGALLARRAASGATVTLQVSSQRTTATSRNVIGDLAGDTWPNEWLVLAAHHDTAVDSPGANDNASGSTVVLEVARLLVQLKRE